MENFDNVNTYVLGAKFGIIVIIIIMGVIIVKSPASSFDEAAARKISAKVFETIENFGNTEFWSIARYICCSKRKITVYRRIFVDNNNNGKDIIDLLLFSENSVVWMDFQKILL